MFYTLAVFYYSKEQDLTRHYSQLKVSKLGEDSWLVVEPWHTPYGSVAKGTVSNAANIPLILWWFMHPTGALFEASVFHDCYYQNAWGTKTEADIAFHQIALDYGTGKFKAYLAYQAVKWFGKGNY